MKVNLRKSTKTILKVASLMIVLITTIVAICLNNTTFKSSLTEEQLFENRVAKNYNELTNDDKETNVPNVKFGAYFLRDIEGNNVAHMLDGTCKKIGNTDDLYFDLAVSGDSYIDNAKIKITNANFSAEFNYLKDDYLKQNYKGTYSQIEFNKIDGGSEEQIYASIKYAPINNYNDYSKTAVITFTADYHDIYTNETTQVEKQIPITVDWYGDLNTVVFPQNRVYGPDDIVGNTVNTLFEIKEYVEERKKDETLLLKDRTIEIKIPNLRQWEPVTARLSDGNATYNPETKTLTLITESNFDENGNLISSIPQQTSYTVYITYPEEAYQYTTLVGADDIFNGKEQLSLKTTVTTHAYNNPGVEFENIVTSENVVYPTIKFTPPSAPPAPLGTTVVVTYEHKNSEISIQRVLENYDKVKEEGVDAGTLSSYFDTHITVQRGAIKDFGLLKIDEEYVKFGQNDVSKYLKDTSIEYYGISEILEDDGKILVYNAETDELIKEIGMDAIRRNSPITIPENVARVRIELTNFKKCEGSTIRGNYIYAGKLADIYVNKALDINAIINDFEYSTLKSLSNYYSKIADQLYQKDSGTLEYTTSESDSSKLKYNKTEAMIRAYPATFGNNGEIDEDAEELGEEITFTVSSKHEQDRAYWGKGEFVIELPDEFNYFNLDSVTSNVCTINGYEYFEENGKKLIRVFAETNSSIIITIKGHLLIDPTATNGSKSVKLYYKNESCADYYNGTVNDKYDVDLNGDKAERIGLASTYVTITSPSTFIVKQMVTNFDEGESFATAPNVAEVDKESNHATIEIGVKNNNASPVIDCFLVGKILYEGNTKVKSGTDLKSEFSTHMTSDGVIIPEDMKNVVVYYSENNTVNFDLNDESNGWTLKENITDWSKVKSFLIDLSKETLRQGDAYHVFKYDVSVPNGLSYNAVSYCTVASSYDLQTNAGILYGRGTEAQKTGVRIVRKYDLNATLLKETTSRAVANEGYIVEELDDQNNVVKSKMGRSDANGKLLIKNLYAERNYRIRQSETNINYEKDDNVRYFRADENAEGDLVFSYSRDNSDLFNNTPSFTKNSETNKDVLNVSMWETPKYEIIINKLDRATDQPISGVNFLCYNANINASAKTNDAGKATVMRFSEGTDYTLEEVTAKGYYLQDSTLRLSKNAQYQYSLSVGNTEFVDSYEIRNSAAQDLATVELTLYNNSVPTYTLNVVKVAEGRNATRLAGAEFEVTKYDDNEKETITTDDNGTATVQNMYQYKEGFDITGRYGLQETTAPHGYVSNKEYIEFVVSKENDALKIEYKNADTLTSIKDTVIEGNNVTIYIQDKALFKLTKTDDDQALIPNVAFVIYELDANGQLLDYAKDANGDYVGTRNVNGAYQVRTDANGEITIPLRDGDYMIFEVDAPAQYEYSSTGRRFRVKADEESTGTGTGTGTGTETPEEEKYTYKVQYYYNGQRDDSKTETYEVDPDTEITEYVDKVEDGYELQYVTKLPYKIECDDLAIDVYYATPKTDTLEINYIEDLIDLQIAVNNGNNYENTKVVLKRDLDFNEEDSYRDYAGTTYGDYNEDGNTDGIKEEVTSGRGWKSIGVRSTKVAKGVNGDYVLDENQNKLNQYGYTALRYFSGTFDGQNHSISNMHVDFSAGEAYRAPEYTYTVTNTNIETTVEYYDYYNAALFGWTHNATIMNLKFDANIKEKRIMNGDVLDEERVSNGAGLVGNSYGSINLFNVENNLTGDFSYGGAIGNIDQRINYFDNENTNINIQDIKNVISIDKTGMVKNDNWRTERLGIIGHIYTGTPRNPQITQIIETNNTSNKVEDISETEIDSDYYYAISDCGTIGFIEVQEWNDATYYQNDKCNMYSINDEYKFHRIYRFGGAIGYTQPRDIAEYKINNIKVKIDFDGGYYNGGVVGETYPKNIPKYLIENFDVKMIQVAEQSINQVGGVIGYTCTNNSNGEDRCVIEIAYGKSTINFTTGSMNGGIAGEPGHSLSIHDVKTYGEIIGNSSENAGLIGYTYGSNKSINIENVNNYVNINYYSSNGGGQYGGIIGYTSYAYISIKNTNNYGNIGAAYQCGGIIGYMASSDGTCYLENVNNYGDISAQSNDQGRGGIIGMTYNTYNTLKNVHNYGKVKGYYQVGGLIGRGGSNSRVELENCSNTADVGGYQYIGGLIGEGGKELSIKDCYNTGNVSADTTNDSCYYLGGLVGYLYGPKLEIENSYNKGNISAYDKHYSYEIGGIVGYYSTSEILVENCYNAGNISLVDESSENGCAYGVGGLGYGGANSGSINNFINKGKIYIYSNGSSTSSNIGGITGGASGSNERITNVINQGEIEIISANVDYFSIGGIVGETKGTVTNAYNTGNITLLGGRYEDTYVDRRGLGGIAGTNTGTIRNCYNTGKIVSMICTGGIVGYNKDNGIVEDCYNEGKVATYKKSVGGIVGKNEGAIIRNTYNVGNVLAKNANVKLGPIVGENVDKLDNDETVISAPVINNSAYSDKVTFIGENSNSIGTKQQDSYMKTTEYYNTLNTNNGWTYINDQYPKLMITAGDEIVEATELNIVNDHKIYMISTMLNNVDAGSITGYGQEYLEQVRHGASNTKAIEMIPNAGYLIGKVEINGVQQEITLKDDGTYTIDIGQLENITSDIIVYVEFLKEDQILTIEKIDKDTNEKIEGATFDITQVENAPITDEISGLKETNFPSEEEADLENTIDEAIGNPVMTKGSYTRIDGGFRFNSAYDRYIYRTYYYAVRTKIPIDLTNYTGEYIVRYDTTYGNGNANHYTYNVYNANDEQIGSMELRGMPNNLRSYTYKLTGGSSYYISIVFEKSDSNFTQTLNNFHVHEITHNIYNMTVNDDGYYETTNENKPWSTSVGHVEVDLSNHPEEHTISVKHQTANYETWDLSFDIVVKNSSTGTEVYNSSCSARQNEQTTKFNIPGGAKYNLEFRYKNLAGGAGKVQITDVSIALDETKLKKVTRTTNFDGEIRVQLPVGKYHITETAAPEHYLLNPDTVEYYVDINKENKVTIKDEHKPIVRVHHYLMENGQQTTKKVANDEEYEGDLDQDYYFNPRNDLEGLSLAKDDNGELIIPSNYKGKYTSGTTDVNFYYEADNIKLTIHHYQEGTQTKVADDEVIEKDAVVEFKQDGSYKVSATGTYKVAENAKYQELTASTYNLTSLYSSVHAGLEIGDTLEYSSNAELVYNYSTKKYRIVTRVIEHEEVVPDEEEDEESEETNPMTNTTSNEIANTTTNETTDENTTNETTNTTENTTTTNTETTPKTKTISVKGGTISGYDLEYYEELASNANSTKDIIVTPDKGYKIKEIKLNDNVVYDADHTTNDLYTVENGVVTFNKFNNVVEDKTITVEFEGVGSIVKVHHIITEEGKEDVEYKTVEIRGKVGSRYTTEEIEIEGYTLYSTSLNTTGEIAEEQIDVYYNYKANPETTYTIRYFYDNTEDVELAERIVGKTKTTVTMEDIQAKIDEHKKDVYEFERAENIPLMIVNDVDEYVVKIYYISTFGKVVEKHIDAGHNTLLYTETHKGSIGTAYNIKSRKIDGYTLLEKDINGKSVLPTNAEGTYAKDVIDTVIYYYTRNTTVKVIYQDENENELDKVIIEGHEGDEYTTEEKTIKGYELVETPKNAEGVMLVTKDSNGKDNTETVVIYKYKKLIPADVVEKYVDINTNEPVEEITHKGEIDEEYEITPKTIEGYTLITKDKDGNDILPTNTKGKYTTEKVEVVYYVAMNTTVRVQHINLITSEKMAKDVVIEGYEGKEYETEPMTFEGYELTGTPENAKGRMQVTLDKDGNKVTELVVKYYYAEKLEGKLPQTSETNSKQAILIAIPFVVLINLGLATIAFKKNKKEDMNK